MVEPRSQWDLKRQTSCCGYCIIAFSFPSSQHHVPAVLIGWWLFTYKRPTEDFGFRISLPKATDTFPMTAYLSAFCLLYCLLACIITSAGRSLFRLHFYSLPALLVTVISTSLLSSSACYPYTRSAQRFAPVSTDTRPRPTAGVCQIQPPNLPFSTSLVAITYPQRGPTALA